MALFRDLDRLEKRGAREEVIRQQTFVSALLLDVGRRSVTFLFLLLLVGSIALLVAGAHYAYQTSLFVVALICFLLGLLCIGILFAINHQMLARFAVSVAWFKFRILDSQIDAALLNSPPANLPKGQHFAVAFGYAAFALWVLGATVSVAAFTVGIPAKIAHVTLQKTGGVPATQRRESPTIQPSVPRSLTLADEIGIGVLAAGFIQAGALIWTILLARRTAQRQLRAYVCPDTADLVSGTAINPPVPAQANDPAVVLMCKNTGQTPAYKVRVYAQLAVIEPKNESTLIAPQLREGQYSTLGTNVTSRNTPRLDHTLTVQETTDIRAGAKAIYLYGRIEYLDVFKHKHFTTFRLMYSGVWPLTAPAGMSFAAQGNEAN